MILYIAGPMTGLPQHNYPAFFAAAERLQASGFDVLNPARIDEDHSTETGEPTWQWYMRRALRMVSEADGIALLPGWEESTGATLEATVGRSLGLDVMTASAWTSDTVKARTRHLCSEQVSE